MDLRNRNQKKDELLKTYPGADMWDNTTRKVTICKQEKNNND